MNVCADGWSFQGPDVYQKFLPRFNGGPLLDTRWPLALVYLSLGRWNHDGKWAKDFFHYPLHISPNLKAGPWLSLRAGRIKTWGHPGWPPGPGCQSRLPSLLPSHQAAGPMGCQPGNNLQTIEAWKPGLDTLFRSHLFAALGSCWSINKQFVIRKLTSSPPRLRGRLFLRSERAFFFFFVSVTTDSGVENVRFVPC